MKLIGILAAFTVALVVFGGSQLTDSFWASAAAVDPTAMPTPEDPQPVYTSYKGVTVGMSQDDARAKLGESSQRSNSGDFYTISDTESVQVLYDKSQTVKSITVNYSGSLKMAPTTKAVLGEDVKKESDGSIYRLVRYPSAGFWVSYNRTAGGDATIIITMQMIPK
ncbi:MAG TPA: hypothetical protein PLD38_08360 [Pyrinomonadaceae bacterium]|nr:hypothetical protein [Chloracidobacterium sp.]MBP9935303.1 hypothetical protein [Pyrinomonadaceae bacterium]MBK7804547.1 hypothetical protein [Chloracidobacterium sp.]MBK9438948.1 hypothetical protein [Chloracidobacterium sp.]MBK9768842.1 hypothetical protein [Chloracidobacterium sp.]